MRNFILIRLGILISCTSKDTTADSPIKTSTKDVRINGIDVSHYNTVNWEKLNENIKVVYIKACEGENFKDPKRVSHYQGAKRTHRKAGFFIYRRRMVTGEAQFKNYCDAIKGLSED